MNRPYFLSDPVMTLDTYLARLQDDDPYCRGYYIAQVMREAKPDDVFTFVTKAEIEMLWHRIVRHLGRSRGLWAWILCEWRAPKHAPRIVSSRYSRTAASPFPRREFGGKDEIRMIEFDTETNEPCMTSQSSEDGGLEMRIDEQSERLSRALQAMLSRYDLRDLADAQDSLNKGAALERAMALTAERDSGFSPIALAWELHSQRFERYRPDPRLTESKIDGLGEFQEFLASVLAESADPGDELISRP